MLLIGVDTSGRNGSLTLARAPEEASSTDEVEMVETVPLEGGTFSAQLIPQLAELLQRNGASKQDIGGLAVASGPGSFTGLRVGLAAVKGLAEALRKPIVAVSLLEVVALAGAGPGRVVAAIDAGRNELYVGEYATGVLVGEEGLVGRMDFVEATTLKVITTDAALAEILRGSGKAVEVIAHPGSLGIVQRGWQRLRAGERVAPEGLEANYIRRSDAEIFAKNDDSQLASGKR